MSINQAKIVVSGFRLNFLLLIRLRDLTLAKTVRAFQMLFHFSCFAL